MRPAEQLDDLRAVPLFADLDDDALARVADAATEFDAPSGHVLVHPHGPASGMFILREGSVTVEARGREVELGPGEFFGELALLVPDAVRSARVCAKSPIRCLAIDRRAFERLLEAEPRLAVSMLRVLARRLAATNA